VEPHFGELLFRRFDSKIAPQDNECARHVRAQLREGAPTSQSNETKGSFAIASVARHASRPFCRADSATGWGFEKCRPLSSFDAHSGFLVCAASALRSVALICPFFHTTRRGISPARGNKRTVTKEPSAAADNTHETIPFTDRFLAAMPLPIVIADDSLLARKVLTKALPPDWDVEIAYASNGREALALYRAGKASVMFLDLTMPDMTGYQVLEALQHEDLNTFVIVVSADIQPMAQERVRTLGAIAFIPKPVTPEAVLPILKEYGLYA
jgi:CheY-like chemotaxis protein